MEFEILDVKQSKCSNCNGHGLVSFRLRWVCRMCKGTSKGAKSMTIKIKSKKENNNE